MDVFSPDVHTQCQKPAYYFYKLGMELHHKKQFPASDIKRSGLIYTIFKIQKLYIRTKI